MDEIEKAKEDALLLVAEIAETDDQNVPVLLLGLKGILENCPKGSPQGVQVRNDLWTYDVMSVLCLALKQDFSSIKGQWKTSAELAYLLSQCCTGIDLPEQSQYEFNGVFLPEALESMFILAGRIQELHTRSLQLEEKHGLLKDFRTVIDSISWLLCIYRFLAIRVIQSKRVMQLLMCEEPEICLFMISFVQSLIKANRQILKDVNQSQWSSLMDEFVYKISAGQDSSIARASIRLILFLTNLHYPILELLSSKRYRGLKTYLSKWNGRGFDWDVKRLVSLLETESAAQAEAMRFSRAAAVIQAAYHGFRHRQNMKKMNRGITLLQRRFRERREEKIWQEAARKEKEEEEHHKELKRRSSFRSSLNKQMTIIESLPPKGVDKYLQESQAHAAARIQAGFRGMKTRRGYARRKQDALKINAVILIQRQFRRYLKQKRNLKERPLLLAPPGLTDERRNQLQKEILDRREKYPPKHTSIERVKEQHEKCQHLLGIHLMGCGKRRRQEQRLDALLATLQIDSELLLASPKLHEATEETVEQFSSRSAPVIAKARQAHNHELRDIQKAWWEKLWDEDHVDPLLETDEKLKEEEFLNF